MNKRLPSVYKVSDCTHIKNNKTVFSSSSSKINFKDDVRISADVKQLDFVFNTPVTIKTNEGVIHSKIVSKLDDHILTSDNKIIKIKDIQSID